MTRNDITVARLVKALTAKGYPVFTNGLFNLNFGGIRSVERTANRFDDWLYCFFNAPDAKDNGKAKEQLFVAQATVDPGSPWLKAPMDPGGAAAIVPGYYPKVWQYGPAFRGYECLRQRLPLKVYRDNNRDNVFDIDPSKMTEGMYGIFVHPHFQARVLAETVETSSAGCLVCQNNEDHAKLMTACALGVARYGNAISFALFDETEFLELTK